jgi:hypothetical protein
MLAEMDASEILEWRQFYEIEPWGASRDDLRAGIIASTVYNMQRGRGSKHLGPRAFMPDTGQDEPSEPATPAEQERRIINFAEFLNKAYGGVDARKQESG